MVKQREINADTILEHNRTAPCSKCKSPLKEIDHGLVGDSLRQMREARKLTLREVADKLGFSSAGYIVDLEMGRRYWNKELVERYLAACNGKKT